MRSTSSLLWSVSRNNEPPSFLFGTMHVRSQVAHQFLQEVIPYLSQVQVFAAEMQLDEFDPVAMRTTTTLPEEQDLVTFFTPRKFEKIRRSIAKSFGIDLLSYHDKHPFLINSAISESLLSRDNLESLDQELWNQADLMGKVCTGLESFLDQLKIMKEIPIEDAARQILEIGRNPRRFRRNMLRMIDYYVSQDVTKLYQASRKQLQGLRRKLLFDRNKLMAQRFIHLMSQQRVFAGVGAAHLGGAKGMLRLIKRSGFSVVPIKLIRTH